MGRKRDAIKLQTEQRKPRKTKAFKRQQDPEPFGYGSKGSLCLF